MRQTDQSPPEVTPVFNTGKATRTVYDRLKGDHLWLSDKKKSRDPKRQIFLSARSRTSRCVYRWF